MVWQLQIESRLHNIRMIVSGGVCPAGCPLEVYVVIRIFDLGPMCTQYSRGVMASPVGVMTAVFGRMAYFREEWLRNGST